MPNYPLICKEVLKYTPTLLIQYFLFQMRNCSSKERKSLIHSEKRSGPKLEPWGTSDHR